MSFLQKLFYVKPIVRPVGTGLEAGDKLYSSPRRKRNAIKGLIIFSVVLASLLVFPRSRLYQYTVGLEDSWKQENLLAPFQFAIRKDESDLDNEKKAVRRMTPPIVYEDFSASDRVMAKADSLHRRMDRLFEWYGQYQSNRSQGRFEAAGEDSIQYLATRDSLSLRFSDRVWQDLLQSYTNSIPELVSTSRSRSTSDRLDLMMLEEAIAQSLALIQSGVLNIRRNSVESTHLTKRDETAESLILLSQVFDIDEAVEIGQTSLGRKWTDRPTEFSVSSAFFQAILTPNLIFHETESEDRWAEKEGLISPTNGLVRENEVIVSQGDIITPEIQRKLISLDAELTSRSGGRVKWKTLMGQFMLTGSTFLIFFLYLFLFRRPIFDDNKMVLLIALLFLAVILLYGIALRAALLDMYVVPVAIVAILLTVIFDSRVAFFGVLTLAFLGSHFLSFNFAFTFSTVFASTLGIFSVRDIRNRGQFFISASIVFLGYMTVMAATFLLQNTPLERLQDESIFILINSVLLLLAYPALWIFERMFGVITDLTLLELSDTNHPLLKELSLKAPGTFNHVLQVANLAEASAAKVGANALLTRVGALYHDIGKMVKPEYFVENQRGGINPHDGLKPRMSALIIASHVKEGLDLARKYRLPKEVVDFIPMHHGTTRIEYFYHRAVGQRKEGDSPIVESEFRYPGPPPSSRETAILMIADSVEAASRSMVNPNYRRLHALIESIVDARREDGQFDTTNLTFADLTMIKESLLNVLLAVYHVRVKYPGEEQAAALPEEADSGNDTTDALDG
ncbi:MAG: HDIG domain-containing protein [Bacteroidetes bacterium]|nr:HDIG domain-containing protein [Bacteroidota bacterium]